MNFDVVSFVTKPEFWRWYLGLAECVFGAVFLVWATPYGSAYGYFKRELKDPAIGTRFCAALARRKALENLSSLPWRVVGGISLLLGTVTILAFMQPVVSFSLLSLCTGIVLAIVFARIRNRGERRAAALSPRSLMSDLPIWVLVLTSLIAIAPLSDVSNAALRFPSIVVSLVGLLLVATAWFMSSSMATLLTGEDAAVELAVDNRLRRQRIGTCVNLAAGSAFIFMSMTIPMHLVRSPVPVVAYLISSLASLALWVGYTRKWQTPPKLTAAQVDGR